MKHFLLFLCLFAPCALLHAAQPIIVVFLSDVLCWGDSEPYGNTEIKTPNLAKLAAQGVKLNQCYSACAVCSPSRSAILTGRTPYRNGVWQHLSGVHPAHLRTSEITYPKLLKEIGYETCHVGKWHLNSKQQFNTADFPQPHDHGYDYWMATHNNAAPSHKNPNNFVRNGQPVGEMEGFSAQLVAKEAIHWLNNIHDPKKPFVLSVWVHEPHYPIAADPRFSGLYPNHPNSEHMGVITQTDHSLGMIMDALEAKGLTENTLIIFSSDNGPEGKGGIKGGSTGGLRGRKRDDYEGGIRVPGIVRWPGHIKPGSVSDVPVIGTDIFATVLEITGVALPKDRTIDGVSMVPAFAGQPVKRPMPLFWRTHCSPQQDRVAMRIGDWKIIGNDKLDTFELYEIQKDWKEEHNLAATQPEKTQEMKELLLKHWKEIEAEGPKEWWQGAEGAKKNANGINY